MSENINAKLWFSTLADEFFLIPEFVVLEEGDLELFSYFGHKRYVNPNQADSYKVTREAAMAYIRTQVDHFFSTLPDRISKSLGEIDWSNTAEKFVDVVAQLFSKNDEKTDEPPPLKVVPNDDEDRTIH